MSSSSDKPAEVYTRTSSTERNAAIDEVAGVKIGGSASLDELFRNRGSNNRFNISPVEAHRQMQNKITGGK